MSTPNPLAPQGSILEQQGRGKSTLQIITFIGALHVFFLCGLLWIGCKKDDHPASNDPLANPGQPIGGNVDSNLASIPIAQPVPISPTPAPASSLAPSPSLSLAPAASVPAATPAPVDAAPAAAATGPSEYRVKKGDIGTSIASKNGVSLSALKAANPNTKWTALKVGDKLQIPAADAHTSPKPIGALAMATPAGVGSGIVAADGSVYEVKPGDNGGRIAKKTGVSWKSIRLANHLSNDVIKPKQKLIIPAKGGTGVITPVIAPADASPSAVPLGTPAGSPAPGASGRL